MPMAQLLGLLISEQLQWTAVMDSCGGVQLCLVVSTGGCGALLWDADFLWNTSAGTAWGWASVQLLCSSVGQSRRCSVQILSVCLKELSLSELPWDSRCCGPMSFSTSWGLHRVGAPLQAQLEESFVAEKQTPSLALQVRCWWLCLHYLP